MGVLLLIAAFGYNFHVTSYKPPSSKHKWRQSDAYSQTLNYYHEDISFCEPKIHLQDAIDGRAAGEFPILYYVNAQVWKITGVNHFTPRLLNTLIVFLGLFHLYKLSRRRQCSHIASLGLIALLLASPIFGFYTNTYLVNLPALGFVFISWYYWDVYLDAANRKSLVFTLIFLALAGLLRPTMLLGIVPMLAGVLLNDKGVHESNRRFFSARQIKLFALLALPFVVVVVWILYIKHYNAENDSVYFLTNTVPLWAGDAHDVWRLFKEYTLEEFYPFAVTLLLLGALFLAFFLLRKNRAEFGKLFLLTAALAIYFLLWFGNFNVHDYYLVEFFVLIPFVYWPITKQSSPLSKKLKSIFAFFLASLVLYLFAYSITKTRLKYNSSDDALAIILLREDEIELWKWDEWFFKENYRAFETITPKLRKAGLKRDDRVISFGDPTSNYTLSLMDQKGWTDLYAAGMTRNDKIPFYFKKGARYLVTNNDSVESEINPMYKSDTVLIYHNIKVFKLKASYFEEP